MELAGEEKKITALFSELKLGDASITPQFGAVWNRAQAKTLQPYRAFNLSFVAVTALLVVALVSLAWWSMSWQRSAPQNAFVVTPAHVDTVEYPKPEAPKPEGTLPAPRHYNRPPVLRSVRSETEMAAANQALTRQAAAISKWESPTSALLSSSSDEIITSLPQLNENANDLKSFLPNRPK